MLDQKALASGAGIKQIRAIAAICAFDPIKFNALIAYISHADKRTATNAAWSAGHAVELNPAIVNGSHHEILLAILKQTEISALKRNILRIWQSGAPLPVNLLPEIADAALGFVADPHADIAVRAYSITVLQHCLPEMPGLKSELMFLLERELPYAKPAFAIRAQRFIRFSDKPEYNTG